MARTSKAVQEINGILKPDDLAAFVAAKYVTWRGSCQKWLDESKELRNYLFQTSTQDTANKKLPWKNNTSIPKLSQLRDNLHANYYAALFPHDDWFKWEAADKTGADRETARVIESYMRQKIRESGFKKAISKALYDYIDYGNAIGEVTYETEMHTDGEGQTTLVYSGPVAHRKRTVKVDTGYRLPGRTGPEAFELRRQQALYALGTGGEPLLSSRHNRLARRILLREQNS